MSERSLYPQKSLQTLPTELQLIIISYLDVADKATLLESCILPPNLLITPHTLNQYDDIGYTLLLAATYAEYQTAVRLLLTSGADPNLPSKIPTDHAATALILASKQNNLKISDLLLSHGANANAENDATTRAVHYAAYNNNLKLVDLLLEYNTDINTHARDWGTSLKIAAENGHTRIVRRLIEEGANVNAAYAQPWRPGHVEEATGRTPLYYAAINGHVECVRELLEAGAIATHDPAPAIPPNKPGWFVHPPSLVLVAAKGDISSFEDWIRAYGARNPRGRIPLKPPFVLTADEKSRYADVMTLLINAGADIGFELPNSRITALHVATASGNEAAVKVLLQEGANVNARTEGGLSAIVLARALGYSVIVEMLEGAKGVRPDWRVPIVGPKPATIREIVDVKTQNPLGKS
ncbi:ankyrin repeat-containing domain protein [Aspergillus crustosus]